jgi:hypothetical protein
MEKMDMKKSITIPIRYLPNTLTTKDEGKQLRMLLQSRKMYKNNKYYTRKSVRSYTSKKSNHIKNAQKIYGIKKKTPNKELSIKKGFSIDAIEKIVKKGEGSYFS